MAACPPTATGYSPNQAVLLHEPSVSSLVIATIKSPFDANFVLVSKSDDISVT